MSTVLVPFWRRRVRHAQENTVRITEAMQDQEKAFDETRVRVLVASRRVENAAVNLLRQEEDLARAVARHGR